MMMTEDKKCPKCGATNLTWRKRLWCSRCFASVEVLQLRAKNIQFQAKNAQLRKRLKRVDVVVEKLSLAVGKLLLCFPERIYKGAGEQKFDIPSYIVDELREAAARAKEGG